MLIPLILATSMAWQEPVYPEGAAIPRSLTPVEERWLKNNPILPPAMSSPPPSDELWCPPEYAPMAGILMSWEGPGSWTTILSKMAREITTTGDADVHIMVDSTGEQNSATTKLQNNSVDMSRVVFHVVNTDTIWMRDYGPRYVYQGDVRSIVDHEYNRPRARDDDQPIYFGGALGHELYEIPLVHGGGNYHLDALGGGYTTRLINNENPGLSEAAIDQIWFDYQALDTVFFDPYPANIDSTQHLDMWMQVVADDVVVISDWPANAGSTQDNICEAAAVEMAARGFTVYRVPARRVGGTHYTYTNVVMCNDLVLIPRYTNGTVSQYNSQAVSLWEQACPGKTVVSVNAQDIVTSAGVLHCIVMHLPAHLGGANPTAHVLTPNGGESYQPGDQVLVEWLSDDDKQAVSATLQLSLDGGVTWPTTIASGQAATGSYNWTVPAVQSANAQLRVVITDSDGFQGSDVSNGDFNIGNGQGAANIPYGSGKAGTLGVPSLSVSALPVIGTSLTIEVQNALPNGLARLIRGPQADSQAFDGAQVLVAYDTIYDLNIDGSGLASLTGAVPNNAALAGVSIYWQAWIPNDPAAAGAGWACSAGLEMLLGY